MGENEQPTQSQAVEQPSGLQWARNESNFDVTAVKPHSCMQNIEQRGNYIHCIDGNHGMRVPAGKILTKDVNGRWQLVDMVVHDVDKKGRITSKLPK